MKKPHHLPSKAEPIKPIQVELHGIAPNRLPKKYMPPDMCVYSGVERNEEGSKTKRERHNG